MFHDGEWQTFPDLVWQLTQSNSLPRRELCKWQLNYEKQPRVSISYFYSIPLHGPMKGQLPKCFMQAI